MKKSKPATASARVVIMLLGTEVAHVCSDTVDLDCVIMQLESGEYDSAGRPVISMQRDRADRHRESVQMAFELSDRIPILPRDDEEASRSYHEYVSALRYGRKRGN